MVTVTWQVVTSALLLWRRSRVLTTRAVCRDSIFLIITFIVIRIYLTVLRLIKKSGLPWEHQEYSEHGHLLPWEHGHQLPDFAVSDYHEEAWNCSGFLSPWQHTMGHMTTHVVIRWGGLTGELARQCLRFVYKLVFFLSPAERASYLPHCASLTFIIYSLSPSLSLSFFSSCLLPHLKVLQPDFRCSS